MPRALTAWFIGARRLSASVALTAALCAAPALAAPGLAYIDPALVRAGVFVPDREGRNLIYRQMEDGLARYRATWSTLPAVRVAPGPALAPGKKGARVAALRARLDLPGGEVFDGETQDALAAFQAAHGLPATGIADAQTITVLNRRPSHYEAIIEANLARAAALPENFGHRFILVDAAAGQLWYFEGGRELAAMKVVVGKPSEPTPMMAGMVRYLLFNPYWNVPEDLVRTSIAPKVLAQGLGYVTSEGLQVLADYSPDAAELDPAQVDWKAVAAGKTSVRVRQRPGPKNMMGRVKLMLPNPLGIYLHDTPHRGDFARSQRLASSGCVRLEDALALARLLAGDRAADAALDGSEEQRVDLRQPTPVYITYFTALPTADGFMFRPDGYGRDKLTRQQVAAGR
jgi:murein L,D-transpeptidase YcbB/YkuD